MVAEKSTNWASVNKIFSIAINYKKIQAVHVN